MIDCTGIILTFNEEANIEKCIHSIDDFCSRIIVVDSFSTDATVQIAKQLGCEVIQHEFINQAQQFDYAIHASNISTIWILRLDADERLSKPAKEEIINAISEPGVSGIIVPFEVTFLGRKLKHGGVYPFRKLIFYKSGVGYVEQKNMDEHIVLKSGKAKTIKSISFHEDYKDFKSWLSKHVNYVFREVDDAIEILENKDNLKSNRKRRFYYKLPSFFRAKCYFIYRYYFRLGFLDGKPGRYFALLQAYFYRVAIDAALYERKIQARKQG